LSHQREAKNKGKLDPEKEKRFDEIGVAWDVQKQQLENYYNLLVKYNNREGHCNVPAKYEEDGEQLGAWLCTQRTANKKGKLNSDLIKRLDEIGVVWHVQKQQWENSFNLLMKYKDREGDCNVPHSHEEDGKKLGVWLDTQRRANKKGKLNTDQIKRLDGIRVVWDVLKWQWENSYVLLVKYKDREGHCNVPPSHEEDGKILDHGWLNSVF